jgi:hypothetical protein
MPSLGELEELCCFFALFSAALSIFGRIIVQLARTISGNQVGILKIDDWVVYLC